MGLETRAYGTARDCLDASLADEPGCIVIDVRLPGMSGLEFQVQLTQLGVRLPVIMMTRVWRHSDERPRDEARRDGFSSEAVP